jgi:hypothetical protein
MILGDYKIFCFIAILEFLIYLPICDKEISHSFPNLKARKNCKQSLRFFLLCKSIAHIIVGKTFS